jgi:hypothetical protein
VSDVVSGFARLVRGDAEDAARKLAAFLPREVLGVLIDALHVADGWDVHVAEHDVDDFSGRRMKRVTYLGRPADQEEWVRSATSGLRHRIRPDTDAPEARATLRAMGLFLPAAFCGVRVEPWDGPGATEGTRCQRCAATVR